MMLQFHVVAFKFEELFSRSILNTVRTVESQSHVMLYIFGTVALVCVNSIALAAELILKARNGERTVEDLRAIVIPPECVFALCCLTLQITTFCRRNREIFLDVLSICGFKRTSVDSVERDHELEPLQHTEAVPAPQSTEAVPAPQSTEAVPSPQSTEAVPAPQSTEAVPSPQSTEAVPAPQSTEAVPSPQSTEAASALHKSDF
ncbi:uncharacterized protein LOC111192414 [Astyanax mexicanus]|uniref:uncharacterized protein LOC111192414 n=1 Tax=Astyanax mexicanus TaxID=7994 RepID=UPI0020CB28A2|nr:uncharacterized protein LOC111192414 [Astyanax mexicanus]